MAKKLLSQKSIDEPIESDLKEVTIRMDRDGAPAELRMHYRLRDGDDPSKTRDANKPLDVRVDALDPNDQNTIDKMRQLALRLIVEEEGPFV